MGTRACIAVWENKESGIFRGKYSHWDGYPDHLGVTLQNWVNRNGLDKTVEILIDGVEAQSGWSTINHDGDYSSIGWDNPLKNNSYWCRGDKGDIYTFKDFDDIKSSWCEYVYILCDKHIEVYSGDELIGEVDYSDVDKMKKLQ